MRVGQYCRWCRQPLLAQMCSLKTRFAVASEEAGLGLKESNFQLPALDFVSDVTLRVCGGPVDFVEPCQVSGTTRQEG